MSLSSASEAESLQQGAVQSHLITTIGWRTVGIEPPTAEKPLHHQIAAERETHTKKRTGSDRSIQRAFANVTSDAKNSQ